MKRIGQLLHYEHIIFANNDLLVPQGAISNMIDVLKYSVLAVPLTTELGAGHNPSQVRKLNAPYFINTNVYLI